MTTKLYYFDGRGRAEIIRIVLGFCDVEYEEVYFQSKEQWEEFKAGGQSAFNQVPCLEIDGLHLVQSGAVVRYLARKYNIYGSNNKESTMIDMYYEGTRDFYSVFYPMVFQDENEILTKVKEVTLPRYLPLFEKILTTNKSSFMTGESISLADLGLLECLLAVEDYLGLKPLDTYPKLKEYYNRLKATDKILKFLNGPHRKGKNDAAYVENVKKVLY